MKFKAWDDIEKFWLNPEYFYITGSGQCFTCEGKKGMYSNEYVIMGMKRYKIVQYTGLKDKNGIRIYGGDIIRELYTDDGLEIGYSKMNGSYYVGARCFSEFPYSYWDLVEIVGNIYENPRLLDKK